MKTYATFSQRFAAMWIDLLVFLPLIPVYHGLESVSRRAALVFSILHVALGQAYSIYSHGRFGKTVGKWAMGIQVVRVSGEPLRWCEAWLRSSVELCLAIVTSLGWIAAFIAIADSEYNGLGWSARAALRAAHEPVWSAWAVKVGSIWFLSEFVTMLFNKQRRALHDFIAGTVVLSVRGRSTVPGAAEQAVAADAVAAGKLK
jgi:uncharacterized RDD family membrane protein YckC